jgi:magnesium-transporting ATPase (P-type)
VWIAVVTFFLYYDLAAVGKTWIARGTVPESFGLWWTHAVVALLACAVIFGPRLRTRLRYRRRAL